MLVERLTAHLIADVVLRNDVRTTFIEIDPPPAIVILFHIVNEVAVDLRPRLNTESVDPAHIAHDTFSQVVDQIFLNLVVLGHVLRISPDPATGDAGIGHVVDMIVADGVVAGVNGQNAGGAVIDVS